MHNRKMNIVDMTRTIEKEISRYQKTVDLLKNGAPVYIWGSKMVGTATAEYLQKSGYQNITFIDSDPKLQGQRHNGINIISPDEVKGPDGIFIVGSANYQNEILKEMNSRGYRNSIPYFSIDILLKKDRYFQLFEILKDIESRINLFKHLMFRLTANQHHLYGLNSKSTQYFERDIITLTEEECFVDAGGYDGDTLGIFLTESKGNFHRYHFFEPNEALIESAKKKFDDNRLIFHNIGLYSKPEIVSFFTTSEMQGRIISMDEANSRINVNTLDEVVKEKISFFKLDIEGSELEALKGAKQHIIQDRPKLAVSVYHRPDDFVDIIQYIHSWVPEYSLFLRTYGNPAWEDVLIYAVYSKEKC